MVLRGTHLTMDNIVEALGFTFEDEFSNLSEGSSCYYQDLSEGSSGQYQDYPHQFSAFPSHSQVVDVLVQREESNLSEAEVYGYSRQEVEAEYSRLLLSLSADLVKNSEVVAQSQSDMQLLHPDWRDENFFNLSELKREAFTSGLVDIFLTDRYTDQ